MALGPRKKRERQEDLWMVSSEVVGTPAHAFYDRLNQILGQHHFDSNVEQLCRRYYKGRLGRPSITPGVYFRSLLLGYFEGIDLSLFPTTVTGGNSSRATATLEEPVSTDTLVGLAV